MPGCLQLVRLKSDFKSRLLTNEKILLSPTNDAHFPFDFSDSAKREKKIQIGITAKNLSIKRLLQGNLYLQLPNSSGKLTKMKDVSGATAQVIRDAAHFKKYSQHFL